MSRPPSRGGIRLRILVVTTLSWVGTGCPAPGPGVRPPARRAAARVTSSPARPPSTRPSDPALAHLRQLARGGAAARATAEAALKQLGAKAAPALARALLTARGLPRKRVALLLTLLGRAALPALGASLKGAAVEGRRRIVTLAGRIIEPEAVKLLLDALKDDHHTVRERAGEALIRRTAEDEVGLMIAAFRRGRPMQRQHLLEVFGVLRDARIPKLLLTTFASVKTTLRRHNQLDCLLRHPRGHGLAVAALTPGNRKLRAAMMRALAYEATSLSRVTQPGWVLAERRRFRAAFRRVRRQVLPALRADLRASDPAVALAAARVMHFLGALGSVRRQEDAYAAALRRRIRTLDPKRFADQLVVAHARLGFIHWQRSCSAPDPLSLCMRTRKVARRGGLPRLVRTVLPRNRRHVQRARSHFRAAWAAWDSGGAASRVPPRDPGRVRRVARARHYAAWAKFMEAEVALEDFLRDGIPSLKPPAAGADPARAARAQLTAWYRRKHVAARGLAATYRAAITQVLASTGHGRRGSIYWTLASHSRVGTVHLELAHQLVKIQAPRWIRGVAARTAFEEAYHDVVDRLEKVAKGAYQACLRTAARKRYFWDLALHCEAELMTADPEGYAAWAGDRRSRLTRIPAPAAHKHLLTREEIRHVLRSHRKAVQACFVKHPPRVGSAGGTLVMRFRLETDGRVTVLGAAGLRNPRTHACVTAVYGRIRFPVGPPRPTEVSYPYHYRVGHKRITF